MDADATRRPRMRDRILTAAREVFAEEGFSGFTMTEVERRVGLAVGTGSIYRHFPSKEALLQAVMAAEVSRSRATTTETRNSVERTIADPDERRVAIYKEWLEDLRRFNRFFAMMLEDGDRNPSLREAIRTALTISPDAGVRQTPLDPYAIAALGGYHLFSIMQGGPFEGIEEEEFVRTVAHITAERGRSGPSEVRSGAYRRRASR